MKKHTNHINTRSSIEESIHGHNDDIHDLFLDEISLEKVFLDAIGQIKSSKIPLFSFGQQGEIYRISLPTTHGQRSKDFVVIKKKKDAADYDLREEFRMQQQISQIKDTNVSVPSVHAFKEMANGEQYVMMDCVDGLTLYSLILKQIIQHNIRQFDIVKPLLLTDKDVERALYQLYRKNGKTTSTIANTLTSLEKNPLLYSHINHFKPFTQEQADRYTSSISKFLDKMHKKGFYHRDLGANIRNIMFGHDGKVYLIDFGFTKKIDPAMKDDPYVDINDAGEIIKMYEKDEVICDIMKQYVRQ